MPDLRPLASEATPKEGQVSWNVAEVSEELHKYALSLCRDRARSEDLVQRTLERLVDSSTSAVRVPIAWAKRILKNSFIDEERRRATRLRATEQLASQPVVENRSAVEARIDLTAALGQLPAELSQALMLVVVERYTYAEAAEVQRVAEGTVKSRVARARKRLADLMLQKPSRRGERPKNG